MNFITYYYLHLQLQVYYIVSASLGGNGGVTPPKFVFSKFNFRDLGHIMVSLLYRNSRSEIVKILKKCTKYINFIMKGYAPRISVCHISIKIIT